MDFRNRCHLYFLPEHSVGNGAKGYWLPPDLFLPTAGLPGMRGWRQCTAYIVCWIPGLGFGRGERDIEYRDEYERVHIGALLNQHSIPLHQQVSEGRSCKPSRHGCNSRAGYLWGVEFYSAKNKS